MAVGDAADRTFRLAVVCTLSPILNFVEGGIGAGVGGGGGGTGVGVGVGLGVGRGIEPELAIII